MQIFKLFHKIPNEIFELDKIEENMSTMKYLCEKCQFLEILIITIVASSSHLWQNYEILHWYHKDSGTKINTKHFAILLVKKYSFYVKFLGIFTPFHHASLGLIPNSVFLENMIFNDFVRKFTKIAHSWKHNKGLRYSVIIV